MTFLLPPGIKGLTGFQIRLCNFQSLSYALTTLKDSKKPILFLVMLTRDNRDTTKNGSSFYAAEILCENEIHPEKHQKVKK